MATFYRASDPWTPVYDQFGNFCYWERQERGYVHSPQRQPPALFSRAFEEAPQINAVIDPRLYFAARPPAEGFHPPLDRRIEFHPPAVEVRGPAAGGGRAPPAMNGIGPLPFPPNNFTHPLPQSPPNSSTNEAGQWFLQSNKKGEEYYFNTTTREWQIETPDCLKKYTTH